MSDKLFSDQDEQERRYAPQSVPQENIPPEEVDRGAAAGATYADRDDETIAGADGDRETTPLIAARPDVSSATPIIVPATTESEDDQHPNRDREVGNQ